MWSMRFVLNVLARRMIPWTSYPLESSSSARYEPSCPVIPVISARFICDLSYPLFSHGSVGKGPSICSSRDPSFHKPCQELQRNANSLVLCGRCLFALRKNSFSKWFAENAFVTLSKLINEVQMIVAQKQSAESTNVTINKMPGGHYFSVDTRKFDEVTKIVPATRFAERKTIQFLAFVHCFKYAFK